MRFLLLSSSVPYPARSGSEQRTHMLYRALSELGTVDVIIATPDGTHQLTSDDRKRLVEDFGLRTWFDLTNAIDRWPWRVFSVFGRDWPVRIAKLLRGPSVEFAQERALLKVVEREVRQRGHTLVVTRYLLPFAAARSDLVLPTLVDIDDFPSEVVARKAHGVTGSRIRSWYWRRLAESTRRVEARLLARSRRVWVAKESDLPLAAPCPASVLPNIPFAPADATAVEPCDPADASFQILFVGTLGWKPNEKAVDRFLEECWSDVHRAVPQATFRVVGFGMSESMRSRWGAIAGVEPIGFADDLRSEYAASAFAICPIEEGGGSNIKVLEALRYGRAVVSTPWGARGYERSLVAEGALVVCDSMDSFAAACIDLLRNPVDAAAVAERGRSVVEQQFSYDAFRESVHHAVSAVLAEAPSPSRSSGHR